MRMLLALVLVTACSAQAAAPDPRVADLTTRLEASEEKVEWYAAQLASAQKDARDARAKADQVQCCGTFSMWTKPTVEVPDRYGIAGVPDTFTFHLRFTSEHPVRARIMTYGQLVDLMNGRRVETPYSWGPTTSLDVDFHEATGCAFYVLVLDVERETVFRPDVRITRNPTPPSGACR